MRTMLREMFGMDEAGPVGPGGKLRPEQEKLVKEFSNRIWEETVGKIPGLNVDPSLVHPIAQKVDSILRELLVASEEAEGEDPEHE